MSDSLPPWQTYRRALAPLNYGDALWEPAPIYSYKRIRPGDVGYIREGRFHLLFSAGISLGTRVVGDDVPRSFVPLDVGQIIHGEVRLAGYLRTGTVKEVGADVGASAAIPCSVEPGARLAFELNQQQGAVLVTKHETYREDIERRRAFERYIKKHYDSWVDFAREHDHDSNPKPILVTGVDLTRDFAMVAYSNNSVRMECEFSAAVPAVGSASLSLWGRWRTDGLVHTNCGPRSPVIGTASSSDAGDHTAPVSTIPSEYNQCVFIRYYTMRRRVLIPIIIKAGAGPHDLGDHDSGNDSSDSACFQGLSSGDSDVSDAVIHNLPLDDTDDFDAVAELIFQKSNAESVLLHHDVISDIRRLSTDEMGLERPVGFDLSKHILVDEDGVGTFLRSLYKKRAMELLQDLSITTNLELASDSGLASYATTEVNSTRGLSRTAVMTDVRSRLTGHKGIPSQIYSIEADTPPNFMAIFHPYPQHANMEVEGDVERVARWLGSVVRPAYLKAFYYKPSARNTIIIEVSKEVDKRKLLGQHAWKDILLNPSEAEKRHKSSIFDCVYDSVREVQKKGWKRIDFDDAWFMLRDGRKRTSPHYNQIEWEYIAKGNREFRVPYPLSSYCEVPTEDSADPGLFRPLPYKLFPTLVSLGPERIGISRPKYGEFVEPLSPALERKFVSQSTSQAYAQISDNRPRRTINSLFGDPFESENKNKRDDEVLLCEIHGKACPRGICEVYEMQLREQQEKLKRNDPQEIPNTAVRPGVKSLKSKKSGFMRLFSKEKATPPDTPSFAAEATPPGTPPSFATEVFRPITPVPIEKDFGPRSPTDETEASSSYVGWDDPYDS